MAVTAKSVEETERASRLDSLLEEAVQILNIHINELEQHLQPPIV